MTLASPVVKHIQIVNNLIFYYLKTKALTVMIKEKCNDITTWGQTYC